MTQHAYPQPVNAPRHDRSRVKIPNSLGLGSQSCLCIHHLQVKSSQGNTAYWAYRFFLVLPKPQSLMSSLSMGRRRSYSLLLAKYWELIQHTIQANHMHSWPLIYFCIGTMSTSRPHLVGLQDPSVPRMAQALSHFMPDISAVSAHEVGPGLLKSADCCDEL